MESWATERDRVEVYAALAKVATPVERSPTDAEWILRFGGPKRGIDVAISWQDDLLLFDAPFVSVSPGRGDWSHLEAGGRFAGGAKLARATGEGELRLRAELPVAAGRRLDPALRALREGLRQALVYGRTGALPLQVLPAEQNDPERSSAELAELCSEAGWTFEPRQGGGVAELEVGARFEQARLIPLANGNLLLRVELAACPEGQEPCASAQAHCLMRAAGMFRLVRPAVARGEDGQWQPPRYEVCLAGAATAAEMAEALCALSVACRYSAEELRVLATDAGAAASYLQHQAIADGDLAEERAALFEQGLQDLLSATPA